MRVIDANPVTEWLWIRYCPDDESLPGFRHLPDNADREAWDNFWLRRWADFHRKLEGSKQNGPE